MDKELNKKTLKNILIACEALEAIATANGSTDTHVVLGRALGLRAHMLQSELTEADHHTVCKALGLTTNEYRELKQIYETYFGITSSLGSRFDIDYLTGIPLMLLIGCMPAIRRADYLVEKGMLTSVAVSRKSIVVPVMMPTSSEVFVSDIKFWFSRDCAKIAAPHKRGILREVDQECYERMKFCDSLVTEEALRPFASDARFPTYSKPEYRYYDHISGDSKILKGYQINNFSSESFVE